MAKSKSTAAAAAPAEELHEEPPINVLDEHLNEAHATLDLIYTMVADGGCAGSHLESLCKETLANALNGAMLRIREALKAAERLHAQTQRAASA